MNSLIPSTNHGADLTPFQAAKSGRALRRAEVAVFEHGLRAAARAAMDGQDAQAAADAVQGSLEEELALLEYGLHRANGSAAKTELVARKVQLLSALNDRRITRHFGR
ncbi:MAG: hypothetical protein ACRDZR_00390 [Acidimicrobiales bacterium]